MPAHTFMQRQLYISKMVEAILVSSLLTIIKTIVQEVLRKKKGMR